MNKIKMCHQDELSPGKSIVKRILTRRIMVANHNGEYIGIEADCKHMKASMEGSKIEDGVLTCQWHHWKYDINTGKCLNIDKVKLKKYEIEVSDGFIYIIL